MYNNNEIVDGIVRDICDRGGLQDVWEEIDSETQKDIKEDWTLIINDALRCRLDLS